MVVQVCVPITRKAKAEESHVQGQPGLHSKTWPLSPKDHQDNSEGKGVVSKLET